MLGEDGERLVTQPVVGVAADRFGRDEARFAQHQQVVGDVGLPRAGELDEVAGAQLLARQELDDAGAQRFGQGPDRGIDIGIGAGLVRLPQHHVWMISARSDTHLA